MASCGGCRRCGWHLTVHRRGRLRGFITVQHGCVPRGKRRYSSQREATAAASQRARRVKAWVLAGMKED